MVVLRLFLPDVGPYLLGIAIVVVGSSFFLWFGFEMDNLRPRFVGIAPRFRHFMRAAVSLILCVGFIWLISSDWIAGSLLSSVPVPGAISRSNAPMSFYIVETLLSLAAIAWLLYLVQRIVRGVRRTFRS